MLRAYDYCCSRQDHGIPRSLAPRGGSQPAQTCTRPAPAQPRTCRRVSARFAESEYSPRIRRGRVAPVDARHEHPRRVIVAIRVPVVVAAATASTDAIVVDVVGNRVVEYCVVTMREARTQRRRRLGRPYPPSLPPVK